MGKPGRKPVLLQRAREVFDSGASLTAPECAQEFFGEVTPSTLGRWSMLQARVKKAYREEGQSFGIVKVNGYKGKYQVIFDEEDALKNAVHVQHDVEGRTKEAINTLVTTANNFPQLVARLTPEFQQLQMKWARANVAMLEGQQEITKLLEKVNANI